MNSKLSRSVDALMKHNKEGSYATHSDRIKMMRSIFADISKKYPALSDVRDMKERHVNYIVDKMKSDNLATGTIKNRMSVLRWCSHKIDKQNIVRRTNEEYGIEKRQYVNNDLNRAKELTNLKAVSNDYTSLSLRLQQEFGLRREEAIKFQPEYADKGDHVALKASWCKGGRAREIPITNEQQRQLLEEVKTFCQENRSTALIEPKNNYKQQLKTYEYQTEKAGEKDNHGLRHAYAQRRYEELTGNKCPKLGGISYRKMSEAQREADRSARLLISNELGHNREEVTAVYLGR